MAQFQTGAKREEHVQVNHENAISFLGFESGRVLSTPHMIGYMERTCRNLVLPMLDPGQDTVGTHVNISHCAAAPMGASVVFRAELMSVDNRRIEFRVEAYSADTKIGEGTHQRTIIDVNRFVEKVSRQRETQQASSG